MSALDLGVRHLAAAIALRGGGDEELRGAFAAEFGGEPQSAGPVLAAAASHALVGRRASLFSRDRPVIWDSAANDYVILDSPDRLDALAPAIRAGRAWPALDDCAIFDDGHGLLVFASGSGASTLYHVEHSRTLFLATRPQALRSVLCAPLDRLGAGEIVRFGANYGTRTLLTGMRRIPIGHLLDIGPGREPVLRPYIDFSHRPDPGIDPTEMRAQIGRALDRNLSLIEGPRDLLFSGGVDSALLALRGVASGAIESGWFYAVSPNDPERGQARAAADRVGIALNIVEDQTDPAAIAERIAAYALPTLDFSIIPTHALGSAIVEQRGQTTLIDGTGGDAWFGFGSLAHAGSWLPLQRLRALSPLARRLYMAALAHETFRPLRALKGLARTPQLPSAGLGHMCANPVYSELLSLDDDEWLAIENEVMGVLRSLCGGDTGSAESEVIVSDACLIAVAQFAAKTSQWDQAADAATVYPFLMPNLVVLGRTMPIGLLIRDGQAKPLLKDMVAASPLGRDFAYRRKSGFQPPLQRFLQDPAGRTALFAAAGAQAEAPWTAAAEALPNRLLNNKKTLRIGGLYAIWARLVVETWLTSLRR